jgi:hypothetical protein
MSASFGKLDNEPSITQDTPYHAFGQHDTTAATRPKSGAPRRSNGQCFTRTKAEEDEGIGDDAPR